MKLFSDTVQDIKDEFEGIPRWGITLSVIGVFAGFISLLGFLIFSAPI